jgi:hypothetical protein
MALKRYKAKIVMEIDAIDEAMARQVVAIRMIDDKFPESWNPVKSFVYKIEEEVVAE